MTPRNDYIRDVRFDRLLGGAARAGREGEKPTFGLGSRMCKSDRILSLNVTDRNYRERGKTKGENGISLVRVSGREKDLL